MSHHDNGTDLRRSPPLCHHARKGQFDFFCVFASHCTSCTRRARRSSAVQCPSRWGRVLKNSKVVFFQRSTLKIGWHFLYWDPKLSMQLKCTITFKSRRILAERRFMEDFFLNSIFLQKARLADIESNKTKGSDFDDSHFLPRIENSFSHFYRQLASWLATRAPRFFPWTVCNHHSLRVPPLR